MLQYTHDPDTRVDKDANRSAQAKWRIGRGWTPGVKRLQFSPLALLDACTLKSYPVQTAASGLVWAGICCQGTPPTAAQRITTRAIFSW